MAAMTLARPIAVRRTLGGCSVHTRSRQFSASASAPNPTLLEPRAWVAEGSDATNSTGRAARSTTTTRTAAQGGDGHLRGVFFGKPGAGKGTLSARLVDKYDVLSLSTGDMLRQHIAERTEVGRMAEEIVAHGGLLPDELMLQVVTTKLDALHDRNWILDGFPRTVGQSDLLDSHLQTRGTPLTLIANIDVPDEVILSRIADRWVHLPSGRVYNMQFNRPRVEGMDDVTGEPLTKRPDDNPETFARRLKQFYTSTSPLLEHYASQAHSAPLLVALRGKTTAEIWPQLEEVIARRFPALKPRRAHVAPPRVQTQNTRVADAVLVSLKKGAERAARVGVKQLA